MRSDVRHRFTNPILNADWPDPDAIRVGDTYVMVASSFNRAPGLPVLVSRNLVDWRIAGHALAAVPPERHYELPRHGSGVWAPAIRHHDGLLWIVYPDPDHGIFVTTAADPAGPWSEPHLLVAGCGLIDPCPLWDDDGRAYLAHGWARSRAGTKNRVSVVEVDPVLTTLLGASQVVVDGDALLGCTTLEGPKFYRRDGWYWLFAPAGGVATGWQSVFRSRSPYGPYEGRVVLRQGDTAVNGPHQGAWVTTPAGEDWFLHFQDRGPIGRVVHLQPMCWGEDGWPRIGTAVRSGEPVGEPVPEHDYPSGTTPDSAAPATSDDFPDGRPGPQWHWQANPQPGWLGPPGPGLMRLALPGSDPGTLRNLPNVLGQRIPATPAVVTTILHLADDSEGARAGLVVLGDTYAWLGIENRDGAPHLVLRGGDDAYTESPLAEPVALPRGSRVELRVDLDAAPAARFTARCDGRPFAFDAMFVVTAGRWIGAEVGLFATAPLGARVTGWAEFGPVTVLPREPHVE
jgi:beta-xylosidase